MARRPVHMPSVAPKWYLNNAKLQQRDRALHGTWWRCKTHGLLTEPLMLGNVPHCPDATCVMTVFLVSRAEGPGSTHRARGLFAKEPQA